MNNDAYARWPAIKHLLDNPPRPEPRGAFMPISFKHEGDDRRVIDNSTGEPIEGVIRAQTSAMFGPTYTIRKRGLFGRTVEKTIRADIRIEPPARCVGEKPAPPPMQEVVRGVKFPFVPVVRSKA